MAACEVVEQIVTDTVNIFEVVEKEASHEVSNKIEVVGHDDIPVTIEAEEHKKSVRRVNDS